MNSLKITNLTKTYDNGVKALSNIYLEIENGMFGLLGPNGAGKSTLMKTIVGLQQPDSGGIFFNKENVIENSKFIKSQLGYLPQDFGVYPNIAAYDLLNHLAILKGLNNATTRKEQILALLEKTNLSKHKNKAVSTYSGGMRQRFGVAQALLGNPQIIIVDEPTAGLDPEERNRFNNLLSEIGENIIVILSTHLVEDVRNLCTQMTIINKGELLLSGNSEQFIDKLKGKVWKKQIDKNELVAYQNQYKIISTQLQAGKLNIRVFANENPQNVFAPIEADLEDVYFTTLQKMQ
ncbi:MAG: ABC transporter ATP-binding protein [Chitinophagaceae bacterium]|nr:ABC transporter ATP-binding protein [Chitinophagaceae bacterium]MBP6659943.1 ABC transporter ATP-binding protein [Chitinophagales bacterium]MBP6987355.1 ABC transporter ATP-binding protein [Ferruginibacter sp.]MBK8775134.1 ABC transporter ATP-binding protein [Chitinophagaceae bacterium]MBK8928844.1 ABC transporter ATP-binding protein [Chitinophagaceae bacterium]